MTAPVFCHGNRKPQCLDRLFKKTGNPLFEQLIEMGLGTKP